MASINLVYNRRNNLSKKGLGSLDFRITLNRIPLFISANIKIAPSHWDNRKKEIKKTYPNWIDINELLNEKIFTIEKYFFEQEKNNRSIEINDIKILLGNSISNDSSKFLEFCRKETGIRNDLGNETLHHQLSKFDIIENWLGRDFSFEELDLKFIESLDTYLANERKIGLNTRGKYHALLKTYIKRAVNNKLMKLDDNPYLSFKIKNEETHREHLLEYEVNIIEELDLSEHKNLIPIVDKFLFSCYTGLRFSDYQNLTKANFDFVSETEVYLTFKMLKVNSSIHKIPLHKLFKGKAINIILKYFNTGTVNSFLFPTHTEAYTNRSLKKIGALAKINKKITSHVGRHTFGTLLAVKTNDPMLIKSLMGHKNIDTSMIYINITNKGIEDKLNKIEW